MSSRIAVPVLLLVALAGCAAEPAPVSSTKPVTSTLTCQQFSEAASVIFVAESYNSTGDLSDEKLSAELERAKSLLDEIDVEPETDLADQVAALRPIAAADLGDDTTWRPQFDAFQEACRAQGDDVEISAPGG